jgi:hypothetical protein
MRRQVAANFQVARLSILAAVLMLAPCAAAQANSPATNRTEGQKSSQQQAAKPHASSSSGAQTAALKRDFFAAIRNSDTQKVLSYVPDSGINYGKQPQHLTRLDVEEQLLHRHGVYCTLFDSTCIEGKIQLDAETRTCSDRELLTHPVRTAATEAVRNNVRQAILVAEVKNPKCPTQNLIDFIFNFENGQWKLFSVP